MSNQDIRIVVTKLSIINEARPKTLGSYRLLNHKTDSCEIHFVDLIGKDSCGTVNDFLKKQPFVVNNQKL